MKKIEAFVRHYKLDDIKTALDQKGIQGMTVTEVRGFGRQRGHTEMFRGAEYTIDFVPKIKIEIVVDDDSASEVTNVIAKMARTGQVGDGKIFVTDLSDAVRSVPVKRAKTPFNCPCHALRTRSKKCKETQIRQESERISGSNAAYGAFYYFISGLYSLLRLTKNYNAGQ